MPADLREVVLGDHVEVLSGFAFSSSGFDEREGLPLVRIRDLGSKSTEVRFRGRYDPRFLLSNQDVLVGMDGDFTVERWRGGPALLNQRVCKVMATTDGLSQGYLYWLLGPLVENIHKRTPQTTVRHLSAKSLEGLKVLLPPLPEQRLIAEILDTLDEAIRKTEAIIAKLKQVKQGLLHDLLTRGIDDNGELRDPERHPEQFKDSPLGRIPEGWGVRTVSELIELGLLTYFQDGNHGEAYPRSSEFTNLGTPFISARLIGEGGRIAFDDAVRLPAPVVRRLRIGFGRPRDVILAHNATVGPVGYVGENDPEFIASTSTTIYRADGIQLDARYLWSFLSSLPFQEQLKAVMAQTTRNQVPITAQRLLFCAVPNLDEQKRIALSIWALLERTDGEETEVAKLRLLKRGLMEDLLTGRVRVTSLLEEAAQ